MKLLTPISHLFNNQSEWLTEVVRHSDFLEARERTSTLRLANTTHYHIDFNLNIGLSKNQIDFLVNHVRHRDDIHTITFQAAVDCNDVKLISGMYIPLSPPLSLKDQVQNTKQSIACVRDIIGTDRIIGLENNNYYPTGAYDVCTSSEYLLEVMQECNVDCLLDLAHAIVTCHNLNIDSKTYIDSLLRLGNCHQIHLCQPSLQTGKGSSALMVDSHDLPNESLTAFTIDLMKKYNIEYLTIEYYRSVEQLGLFLRSLKQSSLFN